MIAHPLNLRPPSPCYTHCVRRLIVNADDFGFTSGVNRGILEAHTRGVVTSATLMANGAAFAEGVSLAKNFPTLAVGCHVVLIDGEPVLEADEIPSLTKSGRFRDGLRGFAARALAGRMAAHEITAEVGAQIRKIQATGISVSHVDSHKHAHLFPQVLRSLLQAARECGVRAVRNPFGPRLPLRSSELLLKPNIWKRYAELEVLQRFANKFREAVDREGFATPDGTLGIEVTGTLDERLFEAIAASIPEGTWEFVCHPGYSDADLQAARTRLRESRAIELRVLTLPEAKQILMQRGITLISYRDLACS
jgi:hopanoid biosynthesis associated protein HpnK